MEVGKSSCFGPSLVLVLGELNKTGGGLLVINFSENVRLFRLVIDTLNQARCQFWDL